jgi:hypothetical protein
VSTLIPQNGKLAFVEHQTGVGSRVSFGFAVLRGISRKQEERSNVSEAKQTEVS